MSHIVPDTTFGLPLPQANPAVSAGTAKQARWPALDGLRGLMTLFVFGSHYFGEVPHGTNLACVGWIAVHVFFVLSGFLVGRLIIEKRGHGNFLRVFLLRRACRTFPIYFLCCGAVTCLIALLGTVWARAGSPLPGWSYFAFLQNIFVIARGSVGVHWLSPTWTLALEEQFYLLAPWLFLLAPRRAWVPALCTMSLLGVAARAVGVLSGTVTLAPLAVLPSSMDVLSMGLLLAALVDEAAIPWTRWSLRLRLVPIACLFTTFALQRLDGTSGSVAFQILGPTLIAFGSAVFILTLIEDAPEADRFRSPVLRFFGDISYAVYLTHLAVLGLLHGELLGTEPDVGSLPGMLVTLAAVPVTILVAWLLTVTVERPITAWGRSFRWR